MIYGTVSRWRRVQELFLERIVLKPHVSFVLMKINPSGSAGNLACDAVGGGRIIFYDFGMMDQLSMPLKRGLVNLIFGIYGNDVKEVVDSLEDMDVIRKVGIWHMV